jgi:mannosyltransferase OCH1-like enzyme
MIEDKRYYFIYFIFIGLLIIFFYYKYQQKEYGNEENGNEEIALYDRLKTIKSSNFELKDSYNSVIPLNIYLTWGTKDLPPKMQENVDRMIKVNPEFNIELFDDNDCREFIKKNFPYDIVVVYDTLKPGAYKADLWRLCILYIKGGIYADIKLNCINNFKFIALTEKEHLVLDIPGQWKDEEAFGIYNALIVAKPKNKLLLRCINKISNNVKNKYYGFNALYPTGPGLFGEEYCKEYESITDDSVIKKELDKLNLCIDILNYRVHIIFNNVAILEHYKEYREEQKLFAKTLSYGALYELKQIYNEISAPSEENTRN